MATVTFYHQERADGGRRTGLDVDGEPALQVFVPGGEESDPKLLWYVDVTTEDTHPPASQEDGVAWLSRRGEDVRAALAAAAHELACGIDINSMVPWQFEHPAPNGPLRVSVSAMRRFAAREIGEKLHRLTTSDWPELYSALVSAPR